VPQWLQTGAVVLLTAVLGACSGSVADTLGMGKRSPDEFAVVKRRPLIVPPDYDLRPPDPSARRPVASRPETQTRAALTGVPIERSAGSAETAAGGPGLLRGEPAPSVSSGEAALIRRSQVSADPATVSRPVEGAAAPAGEDASLFERVIAAPADAAEGARETPAVVRRSSTPLENL
jgi:hypothetical protein